MIDGSLALTFWVNVQLQEQLAAAEQQASAAHFGTPAQTQIYRDLRQASIVYRMQCCGYFSSLSNYTHADRCQAMADLIGLQSKLSGLFTIQMSFCNLQMIYGQAQNTKPCASRSLYELAFLKAGLGSTTVKIISEIQQSA